MTQAYPKDLFGLAYYLEYRIQQGMVKGEAGKLTRKLLKRLRRGAPQSSLAHFAQVAYCFARKDLAQAKKLSLKPLDHPPFRLQDLVLAEQWLKKIGSGQAARSVATLRQELFPDPASWKVILAIWPWMD